MATLIAWFDELAASDTATAGGKGANLGELTAAGLPVPPGFVVTADAYLAAMEEGGVRDELRAAFDEARARADDPAALAGAAEALRTLVRRAGVPATLREEVLDAYRRLGDVVRVAVRSSATSVDTAGVVRRDARDLFNVVGGEAVLALVDC